MDDRNFPGFHNMDRDANPCNPQESTQTLDYTQDAPGDIPGRGAEVVVTNSSLLLEGTNGNTGTAASVAISNGRRNIDCDVASPYNWTAHRLPLTPPLTLIAHQVHTKDAESEGSPLMSNEIGQSKRVLPAEGTSGSRLWCASYAEKTLKNWSPLNRSAVYPQNDLSCFLCQLKIDSGLANLYLWAELRSRSSELFAKLGDLINDVVVAFRPYHIDMSLLHIVTDELREVLGTCLSRDAIPEDIELYLPKIRKILTKVLQVEQPVYNPSLRTYAMKRRNVEIQPRTANRIQVTSEVVFLNDGTTTSSYSQLLLRIGRLRADHHQGPDVLVISEMHNCALLLLRNLESWGYLRTQICDTFVEAFRASVMDKGDLRSLSKNLCALLLECLAEDAIPEHVSTLLPDIQSITRKLSKKLEERNVVATQSISYGKPEGPAHLAEGPIKNVALTLHKQSK